MRNDRFAQSAKDTCGPTPVIPLTSEEPPEIVVSGNRNSVIER